MPFADLYRALFETSPDGIAVIDDEGILRAANPSLCRILGGTEDEIVGSHFSRFVPPELGEAAEDAFTRLLDARLSILDFPLVRLDGPRVELQWRLRGNIRPGLHLCIAREIGQQLRTEQELNRRIMEHEVLLDVIPIGIGIARDRECMRIDVNNHFAALLGIPSGTNASLSAPDAERPHSFVVRQGDRVLDAAELPLQVAAATGETVRDFEVEVVRDDGRSLRLLEFAAPLLDDNGDPRGAVGAFVDITERRRIEEELASLFEREKHARERAERAELRSRTLAEASALLATSLDFNVALRSIGSILVPSLSDWCTVELVNESGGVDLVAVEHVDPEKVGLAHEIRRKLPVRLDAPHGVGRVLRTGEPEFVPEITEQMYESLSGDPEIARVIEMVGYRSVIMVPLISRERILGAMSLVTTSESGRLFSEADFWLALQIAHRAAVAIDNSLLFQQAQRARVEAERASAAKDQFLAVLSHELRTPLTPVLAALSMLREDLVNGRNADEIVDLMQRNVELEARLIDDLLDITKIARGKLQLQRTSADVHEVLQHVLDISQRSADDKGLTIDVELDAERTLVHGDGARLQQAFWNIVGNAIKFTPSGGSITVRSHSDDETITTEIADTGVGIAPELIDRIFEPFEQGVGTHVRRESGLGLGLAIARTIVEMHGGTIAVASGPDGTKFTVRLPLDDSVAPA